MDFGTRSKPTQMVHQQHQMYVQLEILLVIVMTMWLTHTKDSVSEYLSFTLEQFLAFQSEMTH